MAVWSLAGVWFIAVVTMVAGFNPHTQPLTWNRMGQAWQMIGSWLSMRRPDWSAPSEAI